MENASAIPEAEPVLQAYENWAEHMQQASDLMGSQDNEALALLQKALSIADPYPFEVTGLNNNQYKIAADYRWESHTWKEIEEKLMDAYPHRLEKAFKTFGFIALGTGLTLIALIVYAMLFGYR